MNFDKESKSDFMCVCVWGGGGGGGGGLGGTVKWGKMQKNNHLHNVEHVVQSMFQIMLIIF